MNRQLASITALLLLASCQSSGICDLGVNCADFYDQVDCHSGEWLEGASCASLGYTESCDDGSDFKCRPADSSAPNEPAGGGCGNGCRHADDGECDDGGPSSDTDLCTLGSDCNDCGPRSASSSGGNAGSNAPDPTGGDDERSTLCYGVTSSGQSEQLEVKCTPGTAVTCADLELQSSGLVYSSRSQCLQDAQNVIDHWTETGDIGGASPDVSSNGSQGGTGGGAGIGGSTCGGGPSTLTLRAVSGCWFERATRPQQVCGAYSDPWSTPTYLCPPDARVMRVNGNDSIAYDYCYVSESQIGDDLQETLEQQATCWQSSLHIIRGTFAPSVPGTSQLVELSPNGGTVGSSGGGSSGSGGVPGLNPGCQHSGEPCASGSCCSGLICFNGLCESL